MIFINFSDGTAGKSGKSGRIDVEVLKRTAQDRVAQVVVVAALLLLAVPRVVSSHLEARAEAQVVAQSEAAAAAELLRDARERTAELERESARLSGTLGRIGDLERGRFDWVQLMDASARVLPAYSWIEAIELDAGARVTVRGVAPSLAQVNQYERALGSIGLVDQLSLSATESAVVLGTPMVRFAIAGVVRRHRDGAGYRRQDAEVAAFDDLTESES